MIRPTAIVTGAARGIGAEIAVRLAEDGHNLALVDLDSSTCALTKERVEKASGKAHIFTADISDEQEVETLFIKIDKEFGPPTVLVNNAGILRDRTIAKLSLEDWTKVIAVNLQGVFLMCRAAFPRMRKLEWSRIVNLSSVAALGNFGEANYSAAKAGVQGLTRTLALEGGRHGITVNAVAPGFIVTEMTREVSERSGVPFEDMILKFSADSAVGRTGQPEDVAHAVAFFADRRSSFITGQILYVAGAPRG